MYVFDVNDSLRYCKRQLKEQIQEEMAGSGTGRQRLVYAVTCVSSTRQGRAVYRELITGRGGMSYLVKSSLPEGQTKN